MSPLQFTAETVSDGVVERDFVVGDVPGLLFSPVSGPAHAPLVLVGHNAGMHKRAPGLVAGARATVTTWGFTVVALDAPGHGDRPRTAVDERAHADIGRARAADDDALFASVSAAYLATVAERAVPEWRATLDALQALPDIGPAAPVGFGGGIAMGTAIGVALTAAEPRITAAVFGGGFFVPEAVLEAARRITVPVQFLLPWDDRYADRQGALALFDAFASTEKTLHANPGDQRTVRWVGLDNGFLARHLGRAA